MNLQIKHHYQICLKKNQGKGRIPNVITSNYERLGYRLMFIFIFDFPKLSICVYIYFYIKCTYTSFLTFFKSQGN